MKTSPVYSRPNRIKHSVPGPQNSVVDDLLILCKLSIDWPAAGDVRAVAAVLCPHVKQHHVSVTQSLVIGSPGVTIVQHSSGLACRSDAVVANMSGASVEVHVVKERGLCLVLLHPGL